MATDDFFKVQGLSTMAEVEARFAEHGRILVAMANTRRARRTMPLTLPEKRDCPDCGAWPGRLHKSGCDVERCGRCGGQRLSCDCSRGMTPRLVWSGIWPGLEECAEFGLYCKRNPDGPGYVPCDPDDPYATWDLNRLASSPEFRWDPARQRYVRA